jgi:hypothetical protein
MVDEDPQAGDDPASPAIGGPPPLDGLPAVPPLRTWFTLAAEAELPLHSYAYHLFREHQNEEWEATMLPFTRLVEADKNPNYDAEEAMFEFADSLEQSLFLVVKDSRFEVIYGMRRCTPIHGLGARVAWLMGDRQLVTGSVIPPSLVIKAQGRNTQSDLFARIATNARPLDEILHAFHADPTAVPHNPAPAHTISS